MTDPQSTQKTKLQQEIATLETAIVTLNGLPSAQAPLQIQLAERQHQLAVLSGQAAGAAGAVTQYQTGGINFGVGANIGTMGDVVGGDKTVNTYGDTVAGDKIAGDRITVGDISGSNGIAIGRGASAHVNRGPVATSVVALFQQVYSRIAALAEDATMKEDISSFVRQIEQEVNRGQVANDRDIEAQLTLLERFSPEILNLVADVLTNPIVVTTNAVRTTAIRARTG